MGGSAPKQDPNMGKAALMSAQTGQQMLDWMQEQAKIPNRWASEDRARYQGTFVPLQDKFIAEAEAYDTPEARAQAASAAIADVNQGLATQRGATMRNNMAMGINPASGRATETAARAATDGALAQAGAGNMAKRQVEETGRALRSQAINLGQGLGVNPGTSLSLATGAGQAGFQGAMSGYGQQASILNQDYQNRMAAWQANQNSLGAIGGAFGKVLGALPIFSSSKEVKTNKRPFDALAAIRKMPVEQWTYKPGEGDGGTHVGPYAEDFSAATGMGDGKSIDALSMMGVALGAIREIDKKLMKLTDRGAMRVAA